MSGPTGEVSLAGEVRFVLAGGRFAVQLNEPEVFPAVFVGQVLTIRYVRPGEAKYVGTTSVWSIDEEHAIVVLTAPKTTGRRQDRHFVRVTHSVRVQVTVLDGDGAAVWSGTTRAKDVSAGGLCLGLPAELTVGTRLRCRFDVPSRTGPVTVETEAQVVRNCDHTYGVEFLALGAALERQLVAAVSWMQLKPRVGV
jgi:hypothetical protein